MKTSYEVIREYARKRRLGVSAEKLGAEMNLETNKVLADKLESTARLIPALMLSNVLLASVVFIAMASYSEFDPKSIAYLPLCIISFLAIIFLRKNDVDQDKSYSATLNRKPRLLVVAISFSLGCFWALLPPAIITVSSGQEFMIALAVLAGILCIGGMTLSLTPTLALPFMIPVLTSCYVTLFLSGTLQSLLMATGLTMYIALILLASLNDTRAKARILLSEKALAKQEKTISLLLRDFDQQASHWLWEINTNGKFVNVLENFAGIAGLTIAELEKMTIAKLASNSSAQSHATEALIQAIKNRESFADINIRVSVRDENYWWSMTGTPDFDDAGSFLGYHGVGSDITREKTSSERIEFLAHHDVLTGLYNRAHFSELLNQNVSRLERYGVTFSLMFLDLDYFKTVNDSYGHPMGDKLLIEVAARISKVMPANAPVARLGGDEFAVIFPDSLSADRLKQFADATLQEITTPFEIDGEKLQIGVSIGMALAPHHGTRPDQLLRNVDLALYRAKESGRNSYCVFEAGMDSVARERRALEFDLRYALEGDELELFYQPFVSAKNNQPLGFEALLRWNHPIRGQISPAEFIPIAESTGLIGSIGEWVIGEACRNAATWPEHLRIAVNLSALQFSKDRVVEIVTESLAASGLNASRLELEITESLLIDQPDDAISKLQHLKSLGVSIAMDDFGTGYSSLSYMLKFPFDKIKVDKSFITAVKSENAAGDVLRTIASLGKSLKVQMTAEGVETLEQAEFLKALAFDQLQGFFYSKPLRASEIPALLLSMTNKELAIADNKVVRLRSTAA
jgi:diguanylate cyclase (GGDEF)-like protein/PAS domain S-box-containing protein